MSGQGTGCPGGCGACCGEACRGGGTLLLTQGELDLLLRFAQTPFLPVARRADSEEPVFLEDGPDRASEMAPIITGLYQKGLIDLDYDLPLVNFDYAAYGAYPHRGSMALAAQGQRALELLEIQEIEG